MSSSLVHPAVVAIGGEKRVRELTPAHVESRLGDYVGQEAMDRVLVTPEYQAFERRIEADGWPTPTDPLALLNTEGQWGVISGLFTFVATKRLERPTLPVVFLRLHEVAEWQRLIQPKASPGPAAEDEEELFIRAFYG